VDGGFIKVGGDALGLRVEVPGVGEDGFYIIKYFVVVE
jgi:hypothetical protein